jgi:hypothetical protein
MAAAAIAAVTKYASLRNDLFILRDLPKSTIRRYCPQLRKNR